MAAILPVHKLLHGLFARGRASCKRISPRRCVCPRRRFASVAVLAGLSSLIAASAATGADSLSVESVQSVFAVVEPGQTLVLLQVTVRNESSAKIFVQSVVPLFTNASFNDRAIDYSMSGGPVPGCIINPSATHVFNVYVDVSLSALTDVPIRIDAAVSGYRLDNDEIESDSSAAAPHTWIVTSESIRAFAALFDSRLTPARSDDSLIARIPVESFPLNTAHYMNGGAPIADVLFETGAAYRLVFQINPSYDWDYEPKLSGKGFCALEGVSRSFGRAAAPSPGAPELLLTDMLVVNEFTDSLDVVAGATKKSDPPLPWSMTSNPWTDPIVDSKNTAEIGSLKSALPAGTFIDCLDGVETWEVSPVCEKDQYYFYELWFQSDLDWESGDTADVYLHIDGAPVPTNIEQLHVRFRLVDDDTIPPAFADFSPEIVPAGESINITCKITDVSGVYDDATGSAGQGVYLLWDDDGSLADGAHEIQMSAIGGGYYATDVQIGSGNEGDVIVYSVHACDNDADGGKVSDRSCGASDVRTIQILGVVYLFDEPGSLYPAAVYSGEENVSIHLELNNPMSQAIVLYTTSVVSFSDGVRSVTANLRNETTVPAGASHFPVSFDTLQVPSDFIAPDTVDLRLDLIGVHNSIPFHEAWTASESNRLDVMKPRLLFTARPLPAGTVHPGDAMIELMQIEVKNDSPADVSVDSLVVSNATVGGGGVPMNDLDLNMLRLYSLAGGFVSGSGVLVDSLAAGMAAPADTVDDAEPPGSVSLPADSLLSWARFEEGEARLRFPGGKRIPAGATLYWFAAADIDSFLASDGDSLDVEIVSPDSVFITGAASVEFRTTPLNSDGTNAIDGFKAFQLFVENTLPDTLYLGDAGQPVLSFILPVNGHMPDVLSSLSVENFGDGEVNDLVERLALWQDDGDGAFSPSNDVFVGDFAATGARFDLSGLSLTLLAPQRFFVVADFQSGPFLTLRARFGVPTGGIDYTSQNDGPIDRSAAADFFQVLLRKEIVSIVSLPISADARHPGDGGVELLALEVGNNTLGGVTVDSLRVRGDSALFPCESGKPFVLYADDGDSSFDPGVDTMVSETAWSGGSAFFAGTRLAIAPESRRILYVATVLDSFLTVDGERLLVGIESPEDIGLTIDPSIRDDLFRLDADFPIVSAGGAVTDGMLAHQVTLYPHGDSVIVDQTTNVLVFDCLVPGNACIDDTLETFTIVNLGTAGERQIERFLLWRDTGDGVFDPAADLSIAAFTAVSAELPAKTYTAQALSEPLRGLPGSRYFVTMDVLDKIDLGGTVDLAIPTMGIAVASGNDGPIDRVIDGPGVFTIPVPDRLTVFTSILGNRRVPPGAENVLNLVLGVYNSYKQSKTLKTLMLQSVGSSRPEEIVKVEAYADSDEDGLFDPAIDGLLDVAQLKGDGYFFDSLGAVLKPYRSTLLFISYGIALDGIRDSIRIDFQISDENSLEFQVNPQVEGDFPLNSAGVDITDGMVNSQMRVLSVPGARVSPGAAEIPCLSFRLPCNGVLEDMLRGLSVENRGTASQGQDISNIKLWRDTGSMEFDSGDVILAFLEWDGSSWETSAPLNELIPCEGLVLHVTADIASTAQDGRSLNLCVPIDGVVVSSGNDGPIDERACSMALIEISTDPLFVSFEVPAAVTRDQLFDVRMGVANAADTTLRGVVPDSFAYAGTGSCTPVSGPLPASIDLAGKSDSSFVWTFKAQSTGGIVFGGRAKEEAGPEASRTEHSDTIRVDEIPQNVTMTVRDLAPVSLNRGMIDVSLVELTLAYDPASGLGAPVEFRSIVVSVANGTGAPLPAKDVVSRMRLRDESQLLCSVTTDTIGQPEVICALSEPVILLPGGSKIFRISVDIPAEAPASSFRLSIGSAGAIVLVDQNSGAAVSFTGTVFPWSTNVVTLKDPASALLVRLVSTAPASVNTGQSDVEVFELALENDGGASAAPVSVSEIVFAARDAGGDTIDAGKIFKAFRLVGDAGNTYAYIESFAGSAAIRCAVQPVITVASGMPVTLRGKIDCLAQPAVSGFSIALEDSLDIAARDANSGQDVEVRAAAESSGFPMSAGVSIFFTPLGSVAVAGAGLMEDRIVAGTTNVSALRLVLSHPGAAAESPFSCAGIMVRILDELGGALAPVDVLDAIRIRKGTAEIASVYITALHGSDIPLSFAAPLVTPPGGADTLDILFDLDADPTRSRFQMHVNEAGIDISDATDGRSGIPLIGSFPLASGLGTVIFPAGQVRFDAERLLPANIAAGVPTACMKLVFTRQSEASGSRVFVEGFAIEVLDEDDRVSDPSLIIDALRVDGESGEIASTWQVATDRIDVAFVDTATVGENETLAFTLTITSAARPPVRAFSLRISSSDAVFCRDEATGGPVTVVPASGAFPFGSGKAAVLARDVETAFSNYPNPFVAGNELTTIIFYMPDEGQASLKVFTMAGEPVRTIIENKSLAAGLHQEFSWDGRNGSGTTVLNGVYYLLLKVSAGGRDYTFKRKVALVQ